MLLWMDPRNKIINWDIQSNFSIHNTGWLGMWKMWKCVALEIYDDDAITDMTFQRSHKMRYKHVDCGVDTKIKCAYKAKSYYYYFGQFCCCIFWQCSFLCSVWLGSKRCTYITITITITVLYVCYLQAFRVLFGVLQISVTVDIGTKTHGRSDRNKIMLTTIIGILHTESD